jgi:hypothetical protein
LSSKLGLYCGEVVEISQPLLPMGMKTPISMGADVQFPDRCSKRDQSAQAFAQLWTSSIAHEASLSAKNAWHVSCELFSRPVV